MSFYTTMGKELIWYLQHPFSNPLPTSYPVFNSGFPGFGPCFTAVYMSILLTQVKSDSSVEIDHNKLENALHSLSWVFTSSVKYIHPLGTTWVIPKGSGSYILFKAQILSSYFFPLWFYWVSLNISGSLSPSFVHWKERNRFSSGHLCNYSSLTLTQDREGHCDWRNLSFVCVALWRGRWGGRVLLLKSVAPKQEFLVGISPEAYTCAVWHRQTESSPVWVVIYTRFCLDNHRQHPSNLNIYTPILKL